MTLKNNSTQNLKVNRNELKISKISCVNDWTLNKIVPFTVTPLEMTCKYLYKSPTFLIAIEIQSMLCMRYDDDKEIKLCH